MGLTPFGIPLPISSILPTEVLAELDNQDILDSIDYTESPMVIQTCMAKV